ncbi:MAG TPA: hypothetical protein VKA44_04215 [Gemmatimonadota bacterium]|nr:hypothetical protein [Gemmatimonadota bacterium]
MTKHFYDENGRRWKAWRASRDVYWPDPEVEQPDTEYESVIFVCFSDPQQPQRRTRLPVGAFDGLDPESLRTEFLEATPEPAPR